MHKGGKRIYNIIVLMVAYRHHLPSLLFNRVSNDEGTDPRLFPCQLDPTDGFTIWIARYLVMGEMFYPSLYRATHYMKIYFLFLPTYYVEIQKGNGNVNIRLGERRCRFLLLSIHQVKCVYLLLSKKIKYSWTRFSFPPLFIT